jgi:hypothetical protein
MKFKVMLILAILMLISKISLTQSFSVSSLHQLDSLLNANINLMKQININDIDMLMLNDCKLNEVENSIGKIKTGEIAALIDFKKTEEIAIYENFSDLNNQCKQIRIIINQYISNLDFWFYKKGLENVAQGDTAAALSNFNKSLLFNPFYIPSLYQQSMLYLNTFQPEKASVIAQFIAMYLFPSGNDYHLINALNEKISKQFKTLGEKLLKTQYYNESLNLFLEADTFCKFIKTSDCLYFNQGIAESVYGMYRSYLRVAEQAFETHNYDIAESFVIKARNYAETNKTTINTNDETDKFLKRILTKYSDIYHNFKRRNENNSAMLYFQKIKTICELIKDKDCESLLNKKEEIIKTEEVKPLLRDSLITTPVVIAKKENHIKVKSKRTNKTKHKTVNTIAKKTKKNDDSNSRKRDLAIYMTLLEMGNDLASVNKNEEALEKYKDAREKQPKAKLDDANNADSLMSKTMVKIVLSQRNAADFMLWSNEFTKVDSLIQYCMNLQHRYRLENDQATQSAIAAIKNKSIEKRSQQIQGDIDQLTEKATNYLLLKEYEKAQSSADEANKLILKHSEYKLSSVQTQKLTLTLKPITTYFKLKETAKQALTNQDRQLFCKSYLEADKLYIDTHLDSLSIPNNNIIAYLNFLSDEALLIFSAEYLVEDFHFEYCLEVLKLLKDKGTDAMKLKLCQQKLAQKQQLIDNSTPFRLDVDKNIQKYTANDKWFRFFNTEYRKIK